MQSETIVSYIIEDMAGDYVTSVDTLRFARETVTRLKAATGKDYAVVLHRDTDGQTEHVRLLSHEYQ